MDIDKLVETAVLQVLKSLRETHPRLLEDGKKILILEKDSNSIWHRIVREVVSPEDVVEDINTLQEGRSLEKYDYIVLPSLTVKRLANIATGLGENLVEETISDVLLLGRRIYLLEEGIDYRRFKKSANKNYYLMIENYENTLVSFGVEIVNKTELYEIIKFGEIEGRSKEAHFSIKNQKVITEKEIKIGLQQGCNTIKIKDKAIITPLAHDLIRANKIKVVTEK